MGISPPLVGIIRKMWRSTIPKKITPLDLEENMAYKATESIKARRDGENRRRRSCTLLKLTRPRDSGANLAWNVTEWILRLTLGRMAERRRRLPPSKMAVEKRQTMPNVKKERKT